MAVDWQAVKDNAETAIAALVANGAASPVSVSFGDRSETYQSVEELRALVDYADEQLEDQAGGGRVAFSDYDA